MTLPWIKFISFLEKFGDGQKVYSKYKAIIRAKIDKIESYIQIEMKKWKNTFLVKSSMKKADT